MVKNEENISKQCAKVGGLQIGVFKLPPFPNTCLVFQDHLGFKDKSWYIRYDDPFHSRLQLSSISNIWEKHGKHAYGLMTIPDPPRLAMVMFHHSHPTQRFPQVFTSEHHQPRCDFHILQQLHHLRRGLRGFAAGELPQAVTGGAKDLAKGGGDPRRNRCQDEIWRSGDGEKMGKGFEKLRIGMVWKCFHPPKNGEVK